MAASPTWKVYRDKEYVAGTKYASDAAALVSITGGTVRYGHSLVVWREGSEYFSAGESYDSAAELMERRVQDYRFKMAKHIATADLRNQGIA